MNQAQAVMGAGSPWQPRILLMEDELNMAQGLQMVLQEVGYAVDLARTGRAALEKFSQKLFDLLVADLRLPDIDGMEVIKTVKEKKPEMQAIVITGYPSVASAVTAVKLGVHEYLRKPFTQDEFMAAVEGALKKKEASIEAILVESESERLIQEQEVVRVLDRASADPEFWHELMEMGSLALKDYRLSMEAKAAIASGDLNWIRKHHGGELTKEQLKFIYKRLEREAW
ncbi:MAG: response regulator [Deltaproteobacteria bacterium HGW-Deltaproteobacteria-15]|nr:MAG: response regulator [Deltaproteobacteria bacterium HGW-Deltaproteobacteria-15]